MQTAQAATTEQKGPTPIEPVTCYFRQSHPGELVELVISYDGKSPHMVYIIRASILIGLLRDGFNFFLRTVAPSAWEKMWKRPFDYPERI